MKTKNIIPLLFSFFSFISSIKSEHIETQQYINILTLTNNLSQESINKMLLDLNTCLQKLPTTISKDHPNANHEISNKITLEADIYFLNDLSNHLQNPTQESTTKLKNWALTSSKYIEIIQFALKQTGFSDS